MGLTSQSTWIGTLKEMFEVKLVSPNDMVIALAGNPNTGKSTIFNSLTGLNQHTGNWPGKTVTNAQGRFAHKNKSFIVVDLPGIYSLMANSADEEVARDFLCFGKPDATVVVTDATCLERNLNLVLQIMEINKNVLICVNLMDEAKRKKIQINLKRLSEILGVPVIGTNARDGEGLEELKDAIFKVVTGQTKNKPVNIRYDDEIEQAVVSLEPYIKKIVKNETDCRWISLQLIDDDKSMLSSISRYLKLDLYLNTELLNRIATAKQLLNVSGITPDELRDRIVSCIVRSAEDIAQKVVVIENKQHNELDKKIDDILTSKIFGVPVMLFLLGIVFWITIKGANYPSDILATGLFGFEDHLADFFIKAKLPDWLHGMLVLGMYRTLAWVVSVMLPPMAIFFPLFTLLEDLGYLPRIAFNLDSFFKKACAHGKQALTMCMGFGCNAAGVIACRIIDSPRERLIATITNNFIPCNGRFPTLIVLSTIFIANTFERFESAMAALLLLCIITTGVVLTIVVSKILSKTILKGVPSSFTLELPPYRKPQVGRILIRSLLDRTIFVLFRAVSVAAPTGLIIWLMANITVGSNTILNHGAGILQPFGHLLGLDGYILMAFILGFPANEIVIPIIIMSYLTESSIMELSSSNALKELLISNGWTWLTAVCMMLFSLSHFPCGTTLLTIYKETHSVKWTWIALMVPTLTGIILCFLVANSVRFLGLI